MSFDLFLRAGGYWTRDDQYVGGEAHAIGSCAAEGFSINTIMVLVEHVGYAENMKLVSWFPPETPNQKQDIVDDDLLKQVVSCAVRSGALTLFIVREDDPFVAAHLETDLGFSSQENDGSVRISDVGEADDNDVEDAAGIAEYEGIFESCDDEMHEEIDESSYKQFTLGQEYRTIQSCKSAIIKYAVQCKKDIKFEKSDNKRVVAVCSKKKCPWRLSASINTSSSMCVVRTLEEKHECTWAGKVSLLTNARIAELFIEEFRLNPNFSATQLKNKLDQKNIMVSWTICERTRLRCLKTFDDEQAESFARFFDYVAELKRSNPGSTVECEVRESRFFRFYVCFHALKDGWKAACRKIIHIDGTFLKWRMTGQLLVACGRDPNDQMFPIAWGIVDVENKPNWMWFFEHLAADLDLGAGNGITLASDQQKGLVAAVQDVMPFAEHRLCARHVYANWKKKHAGSEFEELFWKAAKSYYPERFDRKMKELKEVSSAAYEDLKISIFCPWSRAYFTEFSKCDAVENNLGESFNAAIREARTKPVIEMLEEIRRRVMVGNEKKRIEAQKVRADYTPRSKALLDMQIYLAKDCKPLNCGRGEYEVGYFNDRFIVKLRSEKSCTCRMFLISGIPCCHMVSALRHEKDADQDPSTLISDWFKSDKLRRCYANGLQAVNGMNLWKVTTDVRVIPPLYKRPPGRPLGSKKRKLEKGEPRPGKLPKRGVRMHCSICKQEGHNKTNCKNSFVPKPKKPTGRPRKNPLPPPSTLSLQASQLTQQQDVQTLSSQVSQLTQEDVPTLSSALPKRRRGRPRKDQLDGSSSSRKSGRGK